MDIIHSMITGEDIIRRVENAINKKKLQWKNEKSIAIDGGENMRGKNKGAFDLCQRL